MHEGEIEHMTKWLMPFHSQLSEPDTSVLNTTLRESLRLLSTKLKLDFAVCELSLSSRLLS